MLDQAESWNVSACGEKLKSAAEVDAQVHARTCLQVARKVHVAAQATAAAAKVTALAARATADECGSTELTRWLATEVQLAPDQAAADAGRGVEQQLAAQGAGS